MTVIQRGDAEAAATAMRAHLVVAMLTKNNVPLPPDIQKTVAKCKAQNISLTEAPTASAPPKSFDSGYRKTPDPLTLVPYDAYWAKVTGKTGCVADLNQIVDYVVN